MWAFRTRLKICNSISNLNDAIQRICTNHTHNQRSFFTYVEMYKYCIYSYVYLAIICTHILCLVQSASGQWSDVEYLWINLRTMQTIGRPLVVWIFAISNGRRGRAATWQRCVCTEKSRRCCSTIKSRPRRANNLIICGIYIYIYIWYAHMHAKITHNRAQKCDVIVVAPGAHYYIGRRHAATLVQFIYKSRATAERYQCNANKLKCKKNIYSTIWLTRNPHADVVYFCEAFIISHYLSHFNRNWVIEIQKNCVLKKNYHSVYGDLDTICAHRVCLLYVREKMRSSRPKLTNLAVARIVSRGVIIVCAYTRVLRPDRRERTLTHVCTQKAYI